MKDSPRRMYIAGPMTGIPHFNYPAFNEATEYYRDIGYHVENPAEIDLPRWLPKCLAWWGYMAMSIPQMLSCDLVVALDGWRWSRGARVELWIARKLGMPCFADELLRKTFDEFPECGYDLD